MITPKLKIGLIYGHNHGAVNAAYETIKRYEAEGYRVKPVKVDDTSLTAAGIPFPLEQVLEKFSSINAVVAFMTPDDRGWSVKKCDAAMCENKSLSAGELISRLNFRPRQNVVF